MSFPAKIAFMLTLATAPLALASQEHEAAGSTLDAAGTSLAASTPSLPSQEPSNGTRIPIMMFGIVAVTVTFHRAVFRRRQQA